MSTKKPTMPLARLLALWLLLLTCGGLLRMASAAEPAALPNRKVVVTLPKSAGDKPLSGRLYLFLSQRDRGEPRQGPNWFGPEPFFGTNVSNWAPGETRVVDASADGYPAPLPKIKPGKYRVQALLDMKFEHQNHNAAPGNLYSPVAEWELTADADAALELKLSEVVPERPFPETEFVKEVKFESPLLTKFHDRPTHHRAAVILPKSYDENPQRRYPVVYRIPGFSGSHRDARRYYQTEGGTVPPEGAADFIYVMLSGQTEWGHHVYADSATNGPRGTALVKELVPAIDEKFRTIAKPTARFLTGHSSGGWSSLWLQVAYPETFGGVWSTAPDPVDFRDFQEVNLYAEEPESLYFLPDGSKRPIARVGEKPVLWYRDFGLMDDVIGRGGQLRSFEAVFSPLNEEGLPKQLWDRETGKIDPTVAEAWKKYDISLILQENWETLGPKLKGKLHVIMGDLDTFYLEGATILLKERLERLGSDAEITILPGEDHGFLNREWMDKIRVEMTEQLRQHHPDAVPATAATP